MSGTNPNIPAVDRWGSFLTPTYGLRPTRVLRQRIALVAPRAANRMSANAARGCPIAHLPDIGYTFPMETIFDHAPTPDELRYLADPDATAYRARVTADEALEALSMLFAMRGDAERSAAYARRMSDQDYVRFNLLNHDLIAPPA